MAVDFTPIKALADDARWLDALRALEALQFDETTLGADDAELVAETRARGGKFTQAQAMCGAGPAADAPAAGQDASDDGWEAAGSMRGIETHFKYDAEGLLWLRTAGKMEDIDLFHTVAVIREIPLFGEWIPFVRQAAVVKNQDFARLLTHFTIGVRAVLTRDCVLRVAACNDALSGKALYFEGESLPLEQAEWRGAAVPPRQTGWGWDRMHVHALFAKVSFLSQHAQHCQIVVSVDLRTRLPRAILDFLLKRLVGVFLWLWRRQSRWVSAHEAGPHRAAIAADPAFYEDWLLPKYQEFCRQQGWDAAAELALDPADVEPHVAGEVPQPA